MLQKLEAKPLVPTLLKTRDNATSGDSRYTASSDGRRYSKYPAIDKSVLSLLFGIAIAVGHDRYNSYLDGKQADQINISQDVVIQVGTAFAFLVKTGLTAAVVTSYIQRVWAN
ncbi:hypothetical protein FHL15_010211 [Xylaria flabelliformis]|uniref:Uncharacterized protein n=1 Tax=Xylaria flabelliformis TaxID=2512241 RepID=A0A553HLN4_9PEZI|nr:hypothetical protein FHL15_010211 [Xylaria flabelliformis]